MGVPRRPVQENREDNRKIVLRIARLNEYFVRLEVKDNGYGVKPEVLPQLFNTVKTTKTHNEGNGLGLWQVRQLCERMGARYGIDSGGEWQGATAWIELRTVK